MFTLLDIKKDLYKTGNVEALEMVNAIEKKASIDTEYSKNLSLWLSNKASTVLLRDELCRPFKKASFVDYYSKKLPMPWNNMWEAIDSASLHVQKDKKIDV